MILNKIQRTKLKVILTFSLLIAFWQVHSEVSPPKGSRILKQTSTDVRMTGYFPNVVLITHEGKEVRFYQDLIKDKVVLISFMYTTCEGICPMTIANLVKVQEGLGKRIGRDVFLYSITLDPERDTPEVLKEYAKAVGAKKGWPFLTGKYEDIELLRHRLGIADPDPVIDADRSQHGGILIYGNEAIGRWASIAALNKPKDILKALFRVMHQPLSKKKHCIEKL